MYNADIVYSGIDCLINNMKFQERWEKEGFEKPNNKAKDGARELCRHLFDKYKLIPLRIETSIWILRKW